MCALDNICDYYLGKCPSLKIVFQSDSLFPSRLRSSIFWSACSWVSWPSFSLQNFFLPIECPVSFIYQYEYLIWYSMILFVRWMPQVLKKWKLMGHFSQDVIGCKTQVAFINSDCSALMPRMDKGNRWQQTLETVVKKNKYTVASSGHNTFSHFRFREQERKPKGWCQSEIQCSTITKPWSIIQGKDILKTLQFTSDCSSSCDKHEAL